MSSSPVRARLRAVALAALPAVLAAGVVGVAGQSAAHAATGVDPTSVTLTLGPGQSGTVSKVVHTPVVPPNPDIVLLADTTGSMASAIGSVRASAASVVSAVQSAQPTAQFAVAEYKDVTFDGPAAGFRVDQGLTANPNAVQTGVNAWSASGGGDLPEDYINALFQLASGAVGFRAGDTPIIAWFGDAPSHDPSNGHTLADAIAALQAAGVRVVAVNEGAGGLDSAGQATAITDATGGVLLNNVNANDVGQAILDGIMAIPVTVTPVVHCDAGLSVSFDAASRTVPSGSDAHFAETVHAAPGVTAGTHQCTVDFQVDGKSVGFVEHDTVFVPGLSVNDVTVTEGDTGTVPATFTLSLSAPSIAPVTVRVATADGTATAPADYAATTATVTFTPGQTTRTVTVPVNGDTVDEPDEAFSVNLSGAVGAAITDAHGVGTILDNDRNGVFSCRASALNVAGVEPVVANDPNLPCRDDHRTLLRAGLNAGLVRVNVNALDARTDQTPDVLISAPPAAGDSAESSASVSSVTISAALVSIKLNVITSRAGAECVPTPAGLAPKLTGSSSIAGLSINGLPVHVGSGPVDIPLVIGTLHLNSTVTTPTSVTHRAVWLHTALADVVIAQSSADVHGTAAHPSGNPCVTR
ncbi:MAG TPA: Calx-beta domain-containing protein [Mycobacteriales bacterium]|nr:Calx-beta domain-containing protein [Mycobacteriales bacterium]